MFPPLPWGGRVAAAPRISSGLDNSVWLCVDSLCVCSLVPNVCLCALVVSSVPVSVSVSAAIHLSVTPLVSLRPSISVLRENCSLTAEGALFSRCTGLGAEGGWGWGLQTGSTRAGSFLQHPAAAACSTAGRGAAANHPPTPPHTRSTAQHSTAQHSTL